MQITEVIGVQLPLPSDPLALLAHRPNQSPLLRQHTFPPISKRPAAAELPGPTSKHLVTAGQQRDGGNYVGRMDRIAVWDSVMDEHNYLVLRWNEFVRA